MDESSGGSGGSQASSEGGSGAGDAVCAQDCSQIEVQELCHAAVCDASSGKCVLVVEADGTACDDGDFCTLGTTCLQGACQGGTKNDCGMTADSCGTVVCDSESEDCVLDKKADGAACETDNKCESGGKCQNGHCEGTPKDCFFAPMPDECHVGVCNPATGKCDPSPGNDGDSCTLEGQLCMEGAICQAGACVGGEPKDCSYYSYDCLVGVCDEETGFCESEPIEAGGECELKDEECNKGICNADGDCEPTPTPGAACSSKTDTCNLGSCDDSGVCVGIPTNEGGTCDDKTSCTVSDICVSGLCKGTVTDGPTFYFYESFADNSKGWTLGSEWEIGAAEKSTGGSNCCDPGTDHTPTDDNGVAGVVIGGNASDEEHDPHYLESPVIDLSGAGDSVYLGFYRWLASDYPDYMIHTIDVFNGTDWVNFWEQPDDNKSIIDKEWKLFSYDVTQYKSATFRVRFGIEVGGGFVLSSASWNIDDLTVASKVCDGVFP